MPKYWSFNLSVSPSNEYSGLIFQGTLKSLLQHHNLKVSVIQHSAFFTVQLSLLYMITGKTIALTVQTFVGKVMSLLFNMLSRFIIAFLDVTWNTGKTWQSFQILQSSRKGKKYSQITPIQWRKFMGYKERLKTVLLHGRLFLSKWMWSQISISSVQNSKVWS